MLLEGTGEEVTRPATVAFSVHHSLSLAHVHVQTAGHVETALYACANRTGFADHVTSPIVSCDRYLWTPLFALEVPLLCVLEQVAMEEVDTIIIATLRDVGW